MPRFFRFLFCALVAPVALAAPAGAVPSTVHYDPPVDAPISDPFRAPTHRYAAGNRGIDYATAEGDPVHASADGVVSFAGRVGHGLHLVIAHDDGVRTTYSFLASVGVRRGQRVERGVVVGTTLRSMHFGARIGDAYIDPRELFSSRGLRVRLVDDQDAPPRPAEEERHLLVAYLRRLGSPPTESDIRAWEREQERCTPADEAAPAPRDTSTRRAVLLVGGLGSSTGEAAILAVDTRTLGYAPADVHQFSYRTGGARYAALDTHQDVEQSAANLAAALTELARADPTVTTDVIAHSLGGLVVRAALAAHPSAFERVATIVTLGTPHLGNTLAAAGAGLDPPLRLGPLDSSRTAIAQLATDSDFITERRADPVPPPHLTLRSIAASTDAIVPAAQSRWDAADNVVIDLVGAPTPFDHARLPADPSATIEIARALAKQAPTCVGYADWRLRNADATTLSRAQRAIAEAAVWVHERLPAGGRVVVRR